MTVRLPALVAILSLVALAGCSSAADDESASANGAATDARTAIEKAQYDVNDGYISGSLTVKSIDAKALTFDLSLVQVRLPHNLGDIEGARAVRGAGASYVYDSHEDDCRLELTPSGKNLVVKQTGMCSFGHNVLAENTYMRAGADPGKLRAGLYEGLSVAVNGQTVSGYLYSTVGDLEHGGASCGFSFVGTLGADERSTDIEITDGYETGRGKLLVKDGLNVAISSDHIPNACARVLSGDELLSAVGVSFAWSGLLEPDTTGYRTVQAEKAYFHDSPGSAARKAYVVNGDVVRVLQKSTGDWLEVSYTADDQFETETKGFIAASDLTPAASR